MTTITQERSALAKAGRSLRTREQAKFRFAHYDEARGSVISPADLVFIHITITNPRNYASDDAHARAVEAIGISRFPNTGLSYNRLIMQSGTSYEGQPMGRRGAHTLNDDDRSKCATTGCPSKGQAIPRGVNLNAYVRAYAICQNVGDAVTNQELDALARTIAADVRGGLVKRTFDLHGHRCTSSKDCPGSKMWDLMSRLKALVNHYVVNGFGKPAAPTKPPTAAPSEATLSDTYYAHVHAKECALKLEDTMRELDMTPPNRPAETGTGDAYFAHYWAKHANYLADLVKAKVSS